MRRAQKKSVAFNLPELDPLPPLYLQRPLIALPALGVLTGGVTLTLRLYVYCRQLPTLAQLSRLPEHLAADDLVMAGVGLLLLGYFIGPLFSGAYDRFTRAESAYANVTGIQAWLDHSGPRYQEAKGILHKAIMALPEEKRRPFLSFTEKSLSSRMVATLSIAHDKGQVSESPLQLS